MGAGSLVDSFLRDLTAADDKTRRAREALRALVESLPRCSAACTAPATHAHVRGGARWCEKHAPPDCPPYPRYRAVTAALALLAEGA